MLSETTKDMQNLPSQNDESNLKFNGNEGVKNREVPDISPPNSKRARVVVDGETLRILSDSYRIHFAEFSKNKKKVTQLIPNKVWTKVWADYIRSLGGREPVDEKALKARFRSVLISRESREHKEGDDSASSDGDPTIEEIAVLHSIESYAEAMSTASTKLATEIEKMNTLLQRQQAELSLRSQVESMYAAEKLKNVKINNLHILGQLGIISREETVARVKAVMSE